MSLQQETEPSQPHVDELVLVRHGESVGNVADADARRRGAGQLELDTRDPDTPLSPRGEQQADVLARAVLGWEQDERPDVVLSSPYVRAARTADVVTARLGMDVTLDERLRERDLGILDGFTGVGIRETYPEEARRRERLGKFYYRPPGGESWTDVALRVRHVLVDLSTSQQGRRVWVFTHQAVIMAFRLVLEGLDEQRVLELDRDEPLGNCSLTRYRRGEDGRLGLVAFADTSHLASSAVEETHESSAGGQDRG